MKKLHTNAYVWGEGYQVDATQEFSNFSPKKIRHFQGAQKPDIVDMAFGWYHEAYIDKQGKLYVCAKAKMSSIKIKEIKDGFREPLTEVTTLPAKTKVRQVAFTRQRMFVLGEDGKIFVFVIKEKPPVQTDILSKKRPQFTGELILDSPIYVKDIPALKMIACGLDHFIGLDKTGKVWAMGDDTFGQCGQGGLNRQAVAPFFELRHRQPVLIQIS